VTNLDFPSRCLAVACLLVAVATAGRLAAPSAQTLSGEPAAKERAQILASKDKKHMTDLQSRIFSDAATGLDLPYRLFVPAGCDTQHPCGLLLLLHGAGERGTDNQAQLKNDALAWIAPQAQAGHPTIVVYPQCPADMQWVDVPWTASTYSLAKTAISRPMTAVMNLLVALQRELPIDPKRVLVTGLSMGGYGVFDIIARNPTLFTGALPLCGGGDPSQAPALRDLPIWIFHGDSDPAVPVRGSRQMVRALRDAGGVPRYSEAAGWGHDIWTRAYQDLEVLRWLLAQKRG
jgi:predicted peptidase